VARGASSDLVDHTSADKRESSLFTLIVSLQVTPQQSFSVKTTGGGGLHKPVITLSKKKSNLLIVSDECYFKL
jgi:hypothetical protein